MANSKLEDLSISELLDSIRSREISSEDIVSNCLDRIVATNSAINAFVATSPEETLKQARQIDNERTKGVWLGPLHGVPIAVKDNHLTAGFPTTACSNVLDKDIGTIDASVIVNLKKSGAIIIGKTNMHEWAYGATSEMSAFKEVKNPWNLNHISGGSSGGSGAALAARVVPGALGSDTGGSIRIPASACGVSGIKPTYEKLDSEGVLPLSWSLDVTGPMARDARDLKIILSAMAGTNSSNNVAIKSNFKELKGLNIAVLTGKRIDYSANVKTAFDSALKEFESSGSNLNEITVNHAEVGFSAWNTILHCEASAYHAVNLKNKPEAYFDEVRIHLEAGRCISATDYIKAQQYKIDFTNKINSIFLQNDIIAIPTLPVTAPKIGQKETSFNGVTTTSQDAMTYLAWLANLTGLPAVSIPCGFDHNRLPIGLMLIGPKHSDEELLDIAEAYQQITTWHIEKPAILK